MKTTLAAASFALIAALSGLSSAHASGFNNRSVVPDAALTPTARQDLSNLPVVHGLNQKSQYADAARNVAANADRALVVVGAYCDRQPRGGFNDSTSFASC